MTKKFAFFVFVPALLLALFFVPAAAAAEDGSGPGVSAPPPWEKMFPDGLIKAGQKSSAAKKNYKPLEGKFVGVYHSANWCSFCHMFTPQLIAFYKKNKRDFEVVFVSGDKSEQQMQTYAKSSKMPWLAVPFGKRADTPGGKGYPALIVLTPDGKVLTQIIGANTKEKSDSRLNVDLRGKMNEWLEQHTEK